MSRPPTFDDAFARRQRIRKSRGSAPVPPEVTPVLANFGAALEASTEDPTAALERAIQDAAAEIIRQAVAKVTGALPPAAPTRPPRKERPPMETAKSGNAWAEIEAGAAALAGQPASRLTASQKAQHVDAFLQTPEGRRLYDIYVIEADAAASQAARRRRDAGR